LNVSAVSRNERRMLPDPASTFSRHSELSLTEAALLSVLQDAIDLLFRQLDGQRPTYGSYTGFVFAVVKPDFPSPSTAIGQLHDGVF
jgi:hypothetical protein